MYVLDMVETGYRLGQLRTGCGYTQKQVAEKLGIGVPRSISAWEMGKNLPRIDTLVRLMQLYKVGTLEDILVLKKMEDDDYVQED